MTNPDDTTWNAITALAYKDARIAQLEAENARLREALRVNMNDAGERWMVLDYTEDQTGHA